MRVKKSCNDSKIEFESEQGGEISALVAMVMHLDLVSR